MRAVGDYKGSYSYQPFVLPVLFVIALIITNPEKSELLKQLTNTSKSYLWTITQYFGAALRNFVTKTELINAGCMSLVKAGENSYYVGVAGFWIEPSYWTSIPGWFVITQVIWSTVANLRHIRSYWMELALSILGFIFMSKQLDAKFQMEQAVFSYYFVSSLLVYAITHLGLYPTRMFCTLQPGSMLYGVASSILVFVTANQERVGYSATLRWLGRDIQCAQVCLAVVVAQLMLGHTMGFAGTLAGLAMYYLVVNNILGESQL